jgi:hypothetical protein
VGNSKVKKETAAVLLAKVTKEMAQPRETQSVKRKTLVQQQSNKKLHRAF